MEKDIIEEELKKRDPINESDIILTNPMTEVARLSRKFCPMPRGPVVVVVYFSKNEKFKNDR